MTFIFHHEFQTGLINRGDLWKKQPLREFASKRVIFGSDFIVDAHSSL